MYFKLNSLAQSILPKDYIARTLTLREKSDTVVSITEKEATSKHDINMVRVDIETSAFNKGISNFQETSRTSPFKLKGNSFMERAQFINFGPNVDMNKTSGLFMSKILEESNHQNNSSVSDFMAHKLLPKKLQPLKSNLAHLSANSNRPTDIVKFKLGRKAPLRERPEILGGNLRIVNSCGKMGNIKVQLYQTT